MNSKSHLFISILKSILRIVSCFICLEYQDVTPLAIGMLGAEVLGILEELADKR